jgi:4-hydroxybutyrate CoA-transferase
MSNVDLNKSDYRDRLITASDAAQLVKPGDLVVFPCGREPSAIGLQLASRREELKGVRIVVGAPYIDLGWYDPGWEDFFEVTAQSITATCQQCIEERRGDLNVGGLYPFQPGRESEQPDVVLVEISEPDKHGFCSFGASLWNKKTLVRQGKIALGEIRKNLIRTFGDNWIHISEFDYVVERPVSENELEDKRVIGSLAGRAPRSPDPYEKEICKNVSQLIRDGDTLEIGVGRVTEHLIPLGLLEGKNDLGIHSEVTIPGIVSSVRKGIINGKRKTVNPEIVVVTAIGGTSIEEREWLIENPMFYLYEIGFIEDLRLIGAHDNFVAINQAIAVDLTGQITVESLGNKLISIAGGQLPFVIGSWLSNGGRSITILPSTAKTDKGTVSRIMSILPAGTKVTIQSNLADYVVTEFGIASLRGKSVRQRARELIDIAHPDFRAELDREAKKLYWP